MRNYIIFGIVFLISFTINSIFDISFGALVGIIGWAVALHFFLKYKEYQEKYEHQESKVRVAQHTAD